MSEHRRRIDEVLDPEFLADRPDWRARRLEQEVSQQRRLSHRVIDRLDAALAARHKVVQA